MHKLQERMSWEGRGKEKGNSHIKKGIKRMMEGTESGKL